MDVGLGNSSKLMPQEKGKTDSSQIRLDDIVAAPFGSSNKPAATLQSAAKQIEYSSDSSQELCQDTHQNRFRKDAAVIKGPADCLEKQSKKGEQIQQKCQIQSMMSNCISDKDNEVSSNASHSEKIVKKKGQMIYNSEVCRSSIGGKTTAQSSMTTSSKALPPRCIGVQKVEYSVFTDKRVEEADQYLDQKISILDKYRSSEKSVCYTGAVSSQKLNAEKNKLNCQNNRGIELANKADNIFKQRTQIQSRTSHNSNPENTVIDSAKFALRDPRNSKSSLSKPTEPRLSKNQDNYISESIQGNQQNQQTSGSALQSTEYNNAQLLHKSNIQLNNKIQSKNQLSKDRKRQIQSHQNTIDPYRSSQAANKHSPDKSRPTSGKQKDPADSSSYFPRNTNKVQDRYFIEQLTLKPKMITPTHFQPLASFEKQDDLDIKQSVLQSIALMRQQPKTSQIIDSKCSDNAQQSCKIGQNIYVSNGITIHKNGQNIQRYIKNQTKASAYSIFLESSKADRTNLNQENLKMESAVVSSCKSQLSHFQAESNSSQYPNRQRLKSLNMNQIACQKSFSQMTSSCQGRDSIKLGISTPLPKIEQREPNTIENAKEVLVPLEVNKQYHENDYKQQYSSSAVANLMDDISPQSRNIKFDGTLLSREIAKANKQTTKCNHFNAPREYKPPLGAKSVAPSAKSNGGLRGSTVQSMGSQFFQKQQQLQLSKNSSKQSLNYQLTASQPAGCSDQYEQTEIYGMNGASQASKQQRQQVMHRNSDLKKPAHSIVGYLAGMTVMQSQLNNRPASNQSKANQIHGAFGTGYTTKSKL